MILRVAGFAFHRMACDTPVQMSFPTTLAIAAALLSLAVFAGWRGARPSNPAKGPRMIPWRMIMLLSAACSIPLLVHLLNLLGLNTGR